MVLHTAPFPAAVFAATLLALPVPPLPAADAISGRLQVDPGSGDAGDIEAHLHAAAKAATAEDLDGFADCFTKSSRTKIRKQAAFRFVQHEVSMEVLDAQILKHAGNSSQAAVRYRLSLSGHQYDVVSLVALKRENGYWRIQSERVQTYEHQSPQSCAPSRYACLSGTCRIQ
jgi:hypothetical protein